MGTKQRLKKERQQQPNQKQSLPKKSSSWVKWLIGGGLVVVVLIITMITVIRLNQEKLIKFSLVSMVQQIQQELDRKQAKFTINDSKDMKSMLAQIETMAADSHVDAVIGGNLNFVMNVLKEIIDQGNLRPDELDKMKSLLAETKRRLEVNKVKKAK